MVQLRASGGFEAELVAKVGDCLFECSFDKLSVTRRRVIILPRPKDLHVASRTLRSPCVDDAAYM